MKNKEIAKAFYEIAELLRLKEENPFRLRAYERASQVIESLPQDIEELARQRKLEEVPGVGKGMAEKIEEYLRTGKIAYLAELKKDFPPGLLDIMSVEGIGPKKARVLHDKLHIGSIQDLTRAVERKQIQKLPGFGVKAEENILRALASREKNIGKMYLHEALTLAREIVRELSSLPYVNQISPAGSLRRYKEHIADIDILCAAEEREAKKVIDSFAKLKIFERVLAAGATKATGLTADGIHVDLRVVGPACYGAALMYFTGSKEHNIKLRELANKKGFTVSEYGLFPLGRKTRPVAAKTEEEVYKKLGLSYIPPTLREARGEIEAAAKNMLPHLVAAEDIKGDIHVHSRYSEGANTISEIAEKARLLGYEWVVIADHSPALKVARGVSIEKLEGKLKEIEEYNQKHKEITLLCGTEVDILSDGSLDYPEAILEKLDFVLAAVHSGFKQTEEQLTRRIIKALQHPLVQALAHPTGRLLHKRDAYAVNIEKVFAVASDYKKILEINAYPERLDLSDVFIKKAKEMGVLLAIGSDAHDLYHLDYMMLGVAQAQRGWLEKKNLLNCKNTESLRKFLQF